MSPLSFDKGLGKVPWLYHPRLRANLQGLLMTAETTTEPVDLTKEPFAGAVTAGKAALAEGGSKADAARAMFALLKDQPRDHAVAALIAGADLTDKGAVTYWYNCKRKAAKQARSK